MDKVKSIQLVYALEVLEIQMRYYWKRIKLQIGTIDVNDKGMCSSSYLVTEFLKMKESITPSDNFIIHIL